jgi:hypothetical protein
MQKANAKIGFIVNTRPYQLSNVEKIPDSLMIIYVEILALASTNIRLPS